MFISIWPIFFPVYTSILILGVGHAHFRFYVEFHANEGTIRHDMKQKTSNRFHLSLLQMIRKFKKMKKVAFKKCRKREQTECDVEI